MKPTFSFYQLPGLNRLLRQQQFPWRSVLVLVVGAIATFGVTLGHGPALGTGPDLQVAIRPAAPRQGDTVALVIEGGTGPVPTVAVNGEVAPVFPVGGDRYRAFVATSPLTAPGRYSVRVQRGDRVRNPAFWLDRQSFPTQRITLRGNQRDLGTDFEFDRVAAFRAVISPEKHWTTPFLRPSPGRVSSPYGVRRFYNGVFAENYYHRGIDYAAPVGTPIVAPARGRVVLVGRVADGFEVHGNTIGIDHGQGVSSIFIHLNTIGVREGDWVQPGQTIGTIGTTGTSTGPHLHWGLYVNGVAVDPGPWLQGGIE